MFIVQSYSLAIVFCVVTMLCWGSWGNTQKLASRTWRYEFFYWDYVLGVLLFSILSAFTLGSFGAEGRVSYRIWRKRIFSVSVVPFWEESFLMHPTYYSLRPLPFAVCRWHSLSVWVLPWFWAF